MQKDNSTLRLKIRLRHQWLQSFDSEPIILETHGGVGRIFANCYRQLKQGIVIEKDAGKAAQLAQQRPTWAVYEGDSLMALQSGIGAHLPVDWLDVDPYGDPWPFITAFLTSRRPLPARLVVVVNDGLRHNLRLGGAWQVGTLQAAVSRHGNTWIYDHYLEVCRESLIEIAAQVGYCLSRWEAYYCGDKNGMAHYAGRLTRQAESFGAGDSWELFPGTTVE